MRRVGAVLIALLLLSVGALAIVVAPTDADLAAPIAVHGAPDHAVRGAEVAVTVTGVHVARRLNRDPSAITAGLWIVVDVRAEATSEHVSLLPATLRLGATTFSRPTDLDGGIAGVDAGIPTEGAMAFEVSRAAFRADGGHAELQVRTSTAGYPEAAPTIDLDLSRSPVESGVDVPTTTVVDR